MYITNATSFLLAWLRDPRAISAITPSGRRISALITQGIGTTTGPVMELGPGTGSFTYSLLALQLHFGFQVSLSSGSLMGASPA